MNPGVTAVDTRTPAAPETSPRLFPRGSALAFFLVTGLFFLWGIPNNLNDVLIRQFMKSFEITRFKAGLVQSAFYSGYFLFSLPAALVMRKFGYKTGLVTGLFLYTAGTWLFWPAAIVRSYYLFLMALFVIASGLGFLETGANPFIAQLGDPESSERRLNFSQAFNPLGSVAGVLIGTAFIFSGVELKASDVLRMKLAGTYDAYLRQETIRVIAPYLVLGTLVFLWALLIIKTKFPATTGESGSEEPAAKGSFKDLFKYPHFLQAIVSQFCYVGAQVGTWSYFIQYVQDYTHQSERIAGFFLTGTLVAFTVGRFASTLLMKFVQPRLLMGVFALTNLALVGIGILFPGWVGLWAIFLTSFFMSLMYPTNFALGIKGLGPNTKLGGSMIVMAIIGGAVFTPVMGLVFEATKSMATAMCIPLACYVVVAYYAFIGSKVRLPREPQSCM